MTFSALTVSVWVAVLLMLAGTHGKSSSIGWLLKKGNCEEVGEAPLMAPVEGPKVDGGSV